MKNISMITAMTQNKVIGVSCGLPWKIKAELEYFKKHTLNKVLIMGGNTFATLNYKPLANRQNIVLTKDPEKFKKFHLSKIYKNLMFAKTIQDSLDQAEQLCATSLVFPEIMVIGGAQIYKQFLPITNKLYISIIKGSYTGDIYFPEIDVNNWQLNSNLDYEEFTAKIFLSKNT